MAEKNITMKRKTAQGWDVYYPKTKGGNIIQDGSNRLVTDAEKNTWNAKETPNGAQDKANKALTDAKAYVDNGWQQKHRVTFHDGTAIGLDAKTDLNTVLGTGFYRGNLLVNAPTADAWHYLMVTKHTESYVMQVASVLDSGFHKDKNTLFIRHMINKVWTAWRAVSLREDWGLWSTNGGQDLMVHGKRAVVGFASNSEDKLHVNYQGDFKNGVNVGGSLTVNTKPVALQEEVDTKLPRTGGTVNGNLNFDKTLNGITWNMNTDYAKVYFKNDSDADTDSYLAFETGDNGNEHFKWLTRNSATTSEMMKLNQSGLTVKGKEVALKEDVNKDLNQKLNKTSDTTDDLHMINPKVVAGSSDHGYLSFFPRTKEPTKRGAYMGFGSAGTDLMTISNETGGDLTLNARKVLANGKELAMKDEVSSLVAGIGQKFKLTQDDGRPIVVSGKSANDLQAGGYYMGAEMKDMALPSTSNWWFIEIMRHGDGWVHQRATWFNTTTAETYERHMYNKAWQPWKKTVTTQGWGYWRTNGGRDFLAYDKRAMVAHSTAEGDKLTLNYGNDFKNGVEVQGKLMVGGNEVIHSGWNVMKDRSVTALVQDDWNAITESGMYLVSDDGKNPKHASTPPNCYPYGVLEVYRTGSNQALFQRYTSHQQGQVFVRSAWAKASWSAWRRLADEDLVNAGDAKQVSKTGDTMTGNLNFDTNGGERRVFATSTDIDAGFYFNKTGLGLYDWKNKRNIFGLNPNTGQLNFEPIRLTKNGVDIATANDVNNRIAKSGDTMTGQLTINMSGGKSTPLVAQNSEGKLRILPYEGDSNYIQSGTTADEAKNLRITGYNGKQMQRVNIHAVDTVVEGNLVAGKNMSLNNGGEPNIFFHDHTSIFSRTDRTGFYDRKEGKTRLAIDNGTKAVQVEGGYNLKVVNGGIFEVGSQKMVGQDLIIHDKRVLVGFNDVMHLNYAKDLPNGVVSNGKLLVNDGQMHVSQNGKSAVIGCGAGDAYLHNSKSGKYLQLKDDGTFSYDGKKVALTDEASHVKWSTFTNFQNGFKPLPEGHALFYGIDQFGFKHIRGLVQGGSTNAGAVIGKLPDFMKPSYWTSITATYDTTGAANYAPCAMHVGWGGELIIQNSRGAASFIVINGLYK